MIFENFEQLLSHTKETGEKYKIIYADPPWKFNNKNTGGSMTSGSEHQYKKVMTVDDICRLGYIIEQISDPDSVLVMWHVASMPKEALMVVRSWGFKFKTMTCFTWLKRTKTGKEFFGLGNSTRQSCEQCLVAIKGRVKRASASVRQFIDAEYHGHSVKPDEVRNRIVELYGDKKRIELFGRKVVDGWNVLGDEVADMYEFSNCSGRGGITPTFYFGVSDTDVRIK